MSIQADIVSALAGVAGGQVFPNAADEDLAPPLAIVRRTVYEPVMTLIGPLGTAKSAFLFECWGAKTPSAGAKAAALAIATAVKAALAASNLTYTLDPVDGEQFDPATLEMMEPIQASFWHADS